jgi:alkylation response protein AidB-like acyl-CoA dehydrogenase
LLQAVEAIAQTAEHCLTSGFVFWCQRVFAEYLVASGNPWLQAEILPQILRAQQYGATGLSNAMKYLAGIESLRVAVARQGDRYVLDGFLPWASNLVPRSFFVAVAAESATGETLVAAIPSTAVGLTRSQDLDLLGLRGSNTAALTLAGVSLSSEWIISEQAREFLPGIRPRFLLLQCGLGLGLARSALREARQVLGETQHVLTRHLDRQDELYQSLAGALTELAGLTEFSLERTRQLFEVRIALMRLAVEAINLELEAQGGAAYLQPSATARRWREVAFLPVLTPSLVQLETELQRSAAVGQVQEVTR